MLNQLFIHFDCVPSFTPNSITNFAQNIIDNGTELYTCVISVVLEDVIEFLEVELRQNGQIGSD